MLALTKRGVRRGAESRREKWKLEWLDLLETAKGVTKSETNRARLECPDRMIKQLGPYRIEKMVGRGGMGTVHAGVHSETGQTAALKVLSLGLLDDTNFRDRFSAEIETLRKLNHPNIVRLYGDGVQDGYLFYAMQFVQGRSLQQMLQSDHRFQWQEVCRIAIDICEALRHAHDRGIIHRDLKPANLLLDQDGQVMLTDFGIAKLFGGTQLTAAGSVVGTADYMPPEQAAGRQVTQRSDLYSLGSVMFTLLARRPPFPGNSLPQVVHSVRYDEIPSVRRFARSVPPALDEIICRLLQKEPENRIPTARAVANQLKAVLQAVDDGDKSQPDGDSGGNDVAEVESDELVDLDDATTRASLRDRGSVTEISPTAVDDDPSGKSDYSWNNATVVTSPGSEVQAKLAAPDTIADSTDSSQDRFVAVDVAASSGAGDQERGESLLVSRFKTALLVVALVGTIAATIWAAWPASADRLYERIVAITLAEDASEARKFIDEFIERFPHDRRLQEIEDLRMDAECVRLHKRLVKDSILSGGSALETYEQRFLEAMRLLQKNPAAARVKFRDFVEIYEGTSHAEPELAKFLKAARHQLERLESRMTPD